MFIVHDILYHKVVRSQKPVAPCSNVSLLFLEANYLLHTPLYAARGTCIYPWEKPQLAKPCGALFHKEVRDVAACSVLAIQSGLILAKSPDLQSSNVASIFNTCLLNPTKTH